VEAPAWSGEDGLDSDTGTPTGLADPHSDADSDGGSRRLTRRRLAVAAVVAVAAAAVAVVLVSRGHGKSGAPTTGVPAGDTTAIVARRTLTESSTVDGTLGYGTTLELYDRLAGTFTWLPSVGATVVRGGTLFRVNDLPVVLMYGSVPAYRTLKQGVSAGPDVSQLNSNLIDLGYDPDGAISDLEDFSEATATAVRRWQKAEGLSQTGSVELGRVLFAPGARRITAVKVSLGQDPPGARKPGVSHKPKATDKPKASKSPAHDASNKSPSKPASGEGSKSPEADGEAPTAGEAVLTTTSTQQLVQLKLKAEQQQLAHLGEHAPVTLPSGGTVQGRIIEVGTVASEAKGAEDERPGSSGEGSGESTIPVTLALDHRVARLDQAPVSVELVKSVRRDVLAVPATALTATAGGGYAIEVLEGARRSQLAVTPGMFANGYVQVEGRGLREGQTVVESE